MSNELFNNITASIIAGFLLMLAAVVSQYFLKRQRKEREKYLEEVDRIAVAVNIEEGARKAAALERVVERIPIGLTSEQFAKLIDEITVRLPTPSTEDLNTTTAVETLINNYHEQALNQARAQFWFSVAAATIGFIWILWAGSSINPENVASALRILPGIVMDAVAFLFFRQASETRQRATELYDRLRRDKQMTESAALVSSIEDVRLRSAVKAQLALHMSGLIPSPIDLGTLLSSEKRPSAEMRPTAT